MIKARHSFIHLITVLFTPVVFFSCGGNTNTPFPENELGYTQPVTIPLQFTAAKNIKWDTAERGGIRPVTKNLDIDALPAVVYDSSGFKPFHQSPEIIKFDFNSLPEKDFDIKQLPSQSLGLKFSVLAPPVVTAVGKMIPKPGKALSIYDMAQFRGIQGQLVGAIYQDRHGLLWIGGVAGLFRYDGENIQTIIDGGSDFSPVSGIIEDNIGNLWFSRAGGTAGVVNVQNGTIGYTGKIVGARSNVSKMMKDAAGNIWLYNAKEKAVNIIDPVTGTYKNLSFSLLTDLSEDQLAPPQTSFKIIQAGDKKIWITTFWGGVDIIDPVAGKIKFLRKNSAVASDSITGIVEDKKNGLIWMGTPTGLDGVDINKGTLTRYENNQRMNRAPTVDLACDDRGQVWKSTVGKGIDLLDPGNEKTRTITTQDGISGTVVTGLLEDNYHRIWIATNAGLHRIDQYGISAHPLGTTDIISLKEDAVGNLWVATQNGILIVNPKRNMAHLLDKAHGLSDDFVQSFWDKKGNIVVATDGGYNIIDPVSKTLQKVGKKEGLVSDTVYTAFSDSYGNTWVTGPSNGIDLIDSARKLVFHADANGGLSANNISDIRQDKEGKIWLATNIGGVDVIDPVKGTVKYLTDQPGLKDTCNRILLQDKHDRMWIGTDKGIYVADTKQGTLTIIGTGQGLSNSVVTSLLPYNESVLAGTNNKVNLITAPQPGDTTKKWQVSIVNNSEDLSRVYLNSWQTDGVTKAGEFLWGDDGIKIIQDVKPMADSNTVYITGINIMTRPKNFVNKNGFPANDSLWSGDSLYTKENGFPKNAGYAMDTKFRWDNVDGPYNLPVNLKLPYTNNYLLFHFTQASLGRPDTVWYTYILEGIDKDWSLPVTNTYTENYLNLPSGDYTFKVSSKGMDGHWSKPATFSFTILPPWYKTWWAYLLYVLLGLGVLRLYIVYRSRKLQKENRVLEEKVKHRTAQLQKSLEDLKTTQNQLIQSEKMASLGELTAGIAHEIQNPLNFVNNFSEVNAELTDELKEELDKTGISAEEKEPIEKIISDIKQNQEKINFHGKRADSIVKGMLQHSRSSNGQKESADINALCDEYLRLSYHGLRAKDKSFNAKFVTDFDEHAGNLNIVKQDVGRVILNLINNAFYAVTEKKKTAGEGYEPIVTVSTRKIKNTVEIIVKDNGDGIPPSVKEKIFQPFFTTKPAGQGTGLGLSLSYDIIKAHGGEMTVKNDTHGGALFTITIPQTN